MTTAHSYIAPGHVWGSWNADVPIVAGLIVAIALYARGARRLRSIGTNRLGETRRMVSFGAGIVTVAVALLSPLDALSGTLFMAHMAQHLLLLVVAPPLLVYGAPVFVGIMGLPDAVRRIVRGLQRSSSFRKTRRVVASPAAAWLLHVGVLWAWHAPPLYQAAVRHDLIHSLEHATFVGTALLFWGLVIQNTVRTRPGYGGAVIFVFATALQSAALGVVLLFASSVIYPIYGGGAHVWGIAPLLDQQVAGATMWIPAGFVYFGTIVVLFARWMREIDARVTRRERRNALSAAEVAGE